MFVDCSLDGTRHKKKKKKSKTKDIERSSGDSDGLRDDVPNANQYSGDSDTQKDELADDEADDDMEAMEAMMKHEVADLGDQNLDKLDLSVREFLSFYFLCGLSDQWDLLSCLFICATLCRYTFHLAKVI
jgi:hypothetical protein